MNLLLFIEFSCFPKGDDKWKIPALNGPVFGRRVSILDSSTYQDWMRSAFVRDWNAASDFIQSERWKFVKEKNKWRYNKRLYEHYGALVAEWSAEAIILNEKYSGPPDTAAGPGDEPLPRGDGHKPLKARLFGR